MTVVPAMMAKLMSLSRTDASCCGCVCDLFLWGDDGIKVSNKKRHYNHIEKRPNSISIEFNFTFERMMREGVCQRKEKLLRSPFSGLWERALLDDYCNVKYNVRQDFRISLFHAANICQQNTRRRMCNVDDNQRVSLSLSFSLSLRFSGFYDLSRFFGFYVITLLYIL